MRRFVRGVSSIAGLSLLLWAGGTVPLGDNPLTPPAVASPLWGWGNNSFGQLGDGTATDSASPVQVGTDTDWLGLSALDVHTVALKRNGTLWAWGENEYGQLGNGTTEGSYVPIQVGTDTDWKTASAGGNHTIAIKNDGSLWGWGENDHGQLGNGVLPDDSTLPPPVYTPTQIGTDTNWQAVSSGGWHTAALKADGSLWAWGYNTYGQVGNGTITHVYSPVQILTANELETSSTTPWKAVSAGFVYTLAIKADGSLWAWGNNVYGQIGINPSEVNYGAVPLQIGADTDWQAVAAGARHTVALKTNGTLWAWGNNTYGQLGNGTATDTFVPTQVGTDTDWLAVSTAGFHSVALKIDGSLWSWGLNFFGELGNGTTTDAFVPTQVGTDTDWQAAEAGYSYTVAIKTWVQIREISSSLITIPQPDETIRITVDAVGPAGKALVYQFFYRAGYGTPEWYSNQWQIVQGWSPISWVDLSFSTPGNYFVVAHVVPAGETWEAGDPQGGFNIAVSGNAQITRVASTLDATAQPGEIFQVTADAVGQAGTTLNYRFYYRAGYGTPAWYTNQWQLLQNWSSANSVGIAFSSPGNYYVVSHAAAAGESWETGDPQGGFSISVE